MLRQITILSFLVSLFLSFQNLSAETMPTGGGGSTSGGGTSSGSVYGTVTYMDEGFVKYLPNPITFKTNADIIAQPLSYFNDSYNPHAGVHDYYNVPYMRKADLEQGQFLTDLVRGPVNNITNTIPVDALFKAIDDWQVAEGIKGQNLSQLLVKKYNFALMPIEKVDLYYNGTKVTVDFKNGAADDPRRILQVLGLSTFTTTDKKISEVTMNCMACHKADYVTLHGGKSTFHSIAGGPGTNSIQANSLVVKAFRDANNLIASGATFPNVSSTMLQEIRLKGAVAFEYTNAVHRSYDANGKLQEINLSVDQWFNHGNQAVGNATTSHAAANIRAMAAVSKKNDPNYTTGAKDKNHGLLSNSVYALRSAAKLYPFIVKATEGYGLSRDNKYAFSFGRPASPWDAKVNQNYSTLFNQGYTFLFESMPGTNKFEQGLGFDLLTGNWFNSAGWMLATVTDMGIPIGKFSDLTLNQPGFAPVASILATWEPYQMAADSKHQNVMKYFQAFNGLSLGPNQPIHSGVTSNTLMSKAGFTSHSQFLAGQKLYEDTLNCDSCHGNLVHTTTPTTSGGVTENIMRFANYKGGTVLGSYINSERSWLNGIMNVPGYPSDTLFNSAMNAYTVANVGHGTQHEDDSYNVPPLRGLFKLKMICYTSLRDFLKRDKSKFGAVLSKELDYSTMGYKVLFSVASNSAAEIEAMDANGRLDHQFWLNSYPECLNNYDHWHNLNLTDTQIEQLMSYLVGVSFRMVEFPGSPLQRYRIRVNNN